VIHEYHLISCIWHGNIFTEMISHFNSLSFVCKCYLSCDVQKRAGQAYLAKNEVMVNHYNNLFAKYQGMLLSIMYINLTFSTFTITL